MFGELTYLVYTLVFTMPLIAFLWWRHYRLLRLHVLLIAASRRRDLLFCVAQAPQRESESNRFLESSSNLRPESALSADKSGSSTKARAPGGCPPGAGLLLSLDVYSPRSVFAVTTRFRNSARRPFGS